MKQTMKKTLALLLVLVQVLVLLPVGMTTATAVEDNEEPQVPELNPIITSTVQFGTFNFLSSYDCIYHYREGLGIQDKTATYKTLEGTDYAMPFVYTDDYFAAPSYTDAVTNAVAERGRTLDWTDLEDRALATASLDFTMACFGSNEEKLNQADYEDGYDKNGTEFLSKCNFQNIVSNDEFNQFPGMDTIGAIFGEKTIKVWTGETNEEYKLVAVGVRGAGYGTEWSSNLTLDASGVHGGFRTAADKVETALSAYLGARGIDARDAKFWVVGYSRAGAVANLVAGDLSRNYGADKKNVYGYTFESAAGATTTPSGTEPVDSAEKTTEYPNIHNVLNKMDAVPYVSMALFGHNRLGVDYRIPFYNNEQTSDQLTNYYNRMYQILQTIALGYGDPDTPANPSAYTSTSGQRSIEVKAEDKWQDDPVLTKADPNSYPIYGDLKVHKFELKNTLNGSMGAVEYEGSWNGETKYIGEYRSADKRYYIKTDKFLQDLVNEFASSAAWDYNPNTVKSTTAANHVNNGATAHRATYATKQSFQKKSYQDALRYLVNIPLGQYGGRLVDAFSGITDNLFHIFADIGNAGQLWGSIAGTGLRPNGWDQYPDEEHADVVTQRLTEMLLGVLDDSDAFKYSQKTYTYGENIIGGDNKYYLTQETGDAVVEFMPVLTRLFLRDREFYGSQYLGTLLKYALSSIIVTHTPELVAAWQMAMDENYTSDFREITLPKAVNISVNVFRDGFEGELDADVQTAASADGSVILTVNNGIPANSKDNRIKVSTSGGTVTIRYPGTMDYRFDVTPISEMTDLNLTLADLAPTDGTNVKATYDRNGSTGNIEPATRNLAYGLTQENTTDAVDVNSYSQSNNIAVKPTETLHIMAWNGSNSLDNDAQQDAQYAIQITTPKTQLVDFGTVTIAKNATPGRVYQAENGEFKASDSGEDVVYQLNEVRNGTGTAFANVDSANADYNADASKGRKQVYLTDRVSVVPASSVYYDDDLNGQSFTSDGHGYSGNIDDTAVSKSATAFSGGSMYFTFYGSGIEAYCTTDSESGYVSAAVFRGAGEEACVSSNRVGKAITVKNQSAEGTRYNTPTIRFTDLQDSPSVFTLEIYANANAKYKLDGVRVYDPVQSGTVAAALQAEAGEGNVLYVNLHDMLVNGGSDFTVNTVDGMTDNFDKTTISGVLFVDNAANLATESHWYKDTEDGQEVWHEQAKPIYTTQFEAYKANSPKNEIYLAAAAKDEDDHDVTQAITFQVDLSKAPAGSTIYIGLSAPETGNGSVTVTGRVNKDTGKLDPLPVTSVMDMYYGVTVPTNGLITITNVGNSLISLTNLKITNVPESRGILAMPPVEKKAAIRSFFAPVTTETVELAATLETDTVVTEPEATPAPAETPTPEETPEPTPTSIGGLIAQLLSNFVQNLFGGIARLFGH